VGRALPCARAEAVLHESHAARAGARAQIGPVLSAYVRELVKLVPGTGYRTSLFEVQDALDEELDTGSIAAKVLNRCLQVYGSGNRTIDTLYTTPDTPSSD
jgi:hypothetical protein